MIGFCLFGAGRIGRIHAGNLLGHHDARLAWVVDVDAEAARRLAAASGARTGTAAEALGDPEVSAVLIASSTDTHADLIEMAARAGKAIFCEKPIDLDVRRAVASVAVVRQANVPLLIGFNRRYDPSFARLKREIDRGTVGNVEVVSITSRDPAPPLPEYVVRSGGLFRDMMIHDFDMARWLLGEEPVSVFARGKALVDARIGAAGDIDTAAVVLETASGRLCQITNSRRCAYGYDQRIEVFGSRGLLRADNATATTVEAAGQHGVTREPALPFFLERYAAAYRIELDEFLKALRGEPAELVTGEDGIQALRLAEAAQRSLESRQTAAVEHAS